MALFKTGQKAVTATAAQITSDSAKVETLILKTLGTNDEEVFFGDSTVTADTGYPLSPGEEFAFDPAQGPLQRTPLPSEVYVIGTAGDTIAFIATKR